jgi:5'-nucleotidase
VNIPATDGDWPLGIRVCPQSLVPMADRYHRAEDPRGKSVYWLDGEMPTEEPGADTDLGALHRRRVTITPLQFDLTDRSRLDELRAWDWPRAID